MNESTPADRETKNMAIEGAIRRLNTSVDTLERLEIRIKEGSLPTAEEPQKPEPTPSLEGTLDSAPNKIDAIRDKIQKIMDEINNSLF